MTTNLPTKAIYTNSVLDEATSAVVTLTLPTDPPRQTDGMPERVWVYDGGSFLQFVAEDSHCPKTEYIRADTLRGFFRVCDGREKMEAEIKAILRAASCDSSKPVVEQVKGLVRRLEEEERSSCQIMQDRDYRSTLLEKFVDAAGGLDACGEHSSHNCPWLNALEIIEDKLDTIEETERVKEETYEAYKKVTAENDKLQARVQELETQLLDLQQRCEKLKSVCRNTLSCVDPVARLGRLPVGGEANGNAMHWEYVAGELRRVLANQSPATPTDKPAIRCQVEVDAEEKLARIQAKADWWQKHNKTLLAKAETMYSALLVMRDGVANLIEDEDLTDEKLREASEGLLPRLVSDATKVLRSEGTYTESDNAEAAHCSTSDNNTVARSSVAAASASVSTAKCRKCNSSGWYFENYSARMDNEKTRCELCSPPEPTEVERFCQDPKNKKLFDEGMKELLKEEVAVRQAWENSVDAANKFGEALREEQKKMTTIQLLAEEVEAADAEKIVNGSWTLLYGPQWKAVRRLVDRLEEELKDASVPQAEPSIPVAKLEALAEKWERHLREVGSLLRITDVLTELRSLIAAEVGR